MRTLKTVLRTFALASVTFTLSISSAAAQQTTSAMPMGSKATAPDEKLTPVPASRVCMVTNKVFDKDQIAIPLGDKTYYGCCSMCKAMLEEEPKNRVAIDPISMEQVDKSEAVIGVAKNGGIAYFASQHNLDLYNARQPE